MENKYYREIEQLIKRQEVNKRVRRVEENIDTVKNYWEIGKLLFEAQGGEKRAKYGNELIKKWSLDYTQKYGSGYSARGLRYMRQLYITYPIWQPVVAKLDWTHYLQILSIKDENKRN